MAPESPDGDLEESVCGVHTHTNDVATSHGWCHHIFYEGQRVKKGENHKKLKNEKF